MFKDGIQIQVYHITNESVNHSSQFTSLKVKKNLRESQVQFREKLRKLRLRQNIGFLIKKPYIRVIIWNTIPTDIRELPTISHFKKKLKEFLKS